MFTVNSQYGSASRLFKGFVVVVGVIGDSLPCSGTIRDNRSKHPFFPVETFLHSPFSPEWQESSGKKSELEWWGKSDRREGKGQKKVGHMQTERNRKQRTGSNWLHLHVVICQHWQELNGTNMHLPCPLGQFPWKRHFSPLHIYNIFIWLGSNSQYSACNLNGLYDIK